MPAFYPKNDYASEEELDPEKADQEAMILKAHKQAILRE